MSAERWVDIPGFEDFYQVSDHGRVRSMDRVIEKSDGKKLRLNSRIKEFSWKEDGHRQVGLSKDGEDFTLSVARLVAVAFVPNPKKLPLVGLKNWDQSDLRADNLVWSNRMTVQNRSLTAGRFAQAPPDKVKAVEEMLATHTQSEISKRLKIGRKCVSKIAAVWRTKRRMESSPQIRTDGTKSLLARQREVAATIRALADEVDLWVKIRRRIRVSGRIKVRVQPRMENNES